MPEQFSIEDFAKSIKAKYPQYAAIPDAELTGKILAKYPQYKSKIIPGGRQAASKSEFEANLPAFTKPENASVLTTPLDFGIGVEKAIGLDPMHPISSSPKALLDAFDSMRKFLGLDGPAAAGQAAYGLVNAPVEALKRGGQAIREQNLPEAAQATGEVYGMAKPLVEGGIEAVTKGPNILRDLAGREELMMRAANLKGKTGTHLPFGTPFKVRAGKMIVDATRKPRAKFYESQAVKGLPDGGGASATIDEASRPRAGIEPEAFETRQEAYDRQRRLHQEPRPEWPYTPPSLKPPSVPRFIQDQLDRIRENETPEQLYDRQQRLRNQEPEPGGPYTPPQPVPPTPAFFKERLESLRSEGQAADSSPLDFETKSPGAHGEGIDFQEPEKPFTYENTKAAARPRTDIDFQGTGEAGTAQPNWKRIEEAIAPKGKRAITASQTYDRSGQPTKFGRDLAAAVPEIASATSATAPTVLMDGLNRVIQDMNTVEDAIPEGTTVDTIPITSQLFALSQEYLERGLPEIAKSLDKIREQWTGDSLPWGEFRAKKKAFFDNHNLRSGPMRRAYGILMDASSRVSPELSAINGEYHTVRKALDAGDVNVATGRRVRAEDTSSAKVPIEERARQDRSIGELREAARPKP